MAVDLDPHPTSVVASIRPKSDGVESEVDWVDVSPEELVDAAIPWRTFRWYHGQKHYSGAYWSSTERALVIYESRLELARLLLADFDRSVRCILAQPFLLEVDVAGTRRWHVPDYLLLSDDGPVVVYVKPARRLAKPQVALTFAWTRLVVESSRPRPSRSNSRRAAHVREVLTGYRSGNPLIAGPDERRTQYGEDVALSDRYAAKAAELGLGVRTVERWVSNLQKFGELSHGRRTFTPKSGVRRSAPTG